MSLIKEYLKLTTEWKEQRGENTIVLYQNGSFFEIYGLQNDNNEISGSLIQQASHICDLKIAQTNKKHENFKVLMAGFKVEVIEKYVKKLNDAGYTIPIYEQELSATGFVRKLSQVISPGTFWSNDSELLSNNTVCVWLYKYRTFGKQPYQITVGMTNLDIFTGKSSMFEFSNIFQHDPTIYDELERYVSIYNPSEMIIIHNLTDDLINDIIQFTSITSKSIIKVNLNNGDKQTHQIELIKSAEKCEKQTYQNEIIKTYFPNTNEEIFFDKYQNYPIATQSFCFLLDFIQKHNPNLVSKINEPFFENCSNRLILANHSLVQLNILSDDRFPGKLSSVSKFLNNCVTNMGKRQFNHNLMHPINDSLELTKHYNITEYLLILNENYSDKTQSDKKNELWNLIRISLQSIKDIEKLNRKLIIKKLTPRDVSFIYSSILNLISLYRQLSTDEKIMEYVNQHDILNNCDVIINLIENRFIVEKCELINEITQDGLSGYSIDELSFIKKHVSTEIDQKIKIYYDSKEQLECIRSYLSSIVQSFEKKTDNQFIKIHETAKSEDCIIGTKRRVMFVKSEIEKILTLKTNKSHSNQSQSQTQTIGPGIIKLEYQSSYSHNKEVFEFNLNDIEYKSNGSNNTNLIITSHQIRSLAQTIQNEKEGIISEIIKFYYNFMDKMIGYQNEINDICKFITTLDIVQCRCYIADKYNYCKPEIEKRDKAFISFEGIRHCLIEHILTKELYVTNELSVGTDYNGYLIFGTNAVGKTSLIRSIGISIIMAQSGLYVPCFKFKYSPYSYLFTRILGNDNLFKGQSTFAVEMSELRTILNMANKDSLILGDELCSGTEQGSATSIFSTGLEFLDKLNSSYIFATHFHEITHWKEITDIEKLKMMHMTVIYDKTSGKLIYDRRLKEGPGENMYGLEVCKALKLPDDFLKRAHEMRIKYYPEDKNTNATNFESSRYNSKKIKGMCERCHKKIGEEVHHLQHQKYANDKQYINSFHKNHPANLMTLCEDCHDSFHSIKIDEENTRSDTKNQNQYQYRRVKTSEGYEIMKI
jgi:DNA mismatch repair protein MutS